MDLNKIWKEVVQSFYLEKIIDKDLKSEYFDTSTLQRMNDNEFAIIVKSTLGVSFLKQFKSKIKILLFKFLNVDFNLKIMTLSDFSKASFKQQQKENTNAYTATFENFIKGKSNLKAFTGASFFCEGDGSNFNPLFIYGDSGLGKTHLLEAIVNEISKKEKTNKVLFLHANEFTANVVAVLSSGEKNVESFKNEILKNDVFVIDDVHFLTKRDKTNEFLFSLINSFLEKGKKLAFSSDKSPEMLNGFEKRMITRFNFGLSIGIDPLDAETAKNILKLRIKEFNLKRKISEEVLDFLSENYCSDARKVKSLVNRLDLLVSSSDSEEEVLLNEAYDYFKGLPISSLGVLKVKKIKEVVGNKYGVSVKAIDGKARTTDIKDARHVAMFLTKTILDHKYTQIGAEFGGRDHTTVLSALKRIEKKIFEDKTFKKTLEDLKNKILSS